MWLAFLFTIFKEGVTKMASYQAQTFNWGDLIKAVRTSITHITGCAVIPTDSNEKTPPYPYVEYSLPNAKTNEASSLHDRWNEVFTVNIQISCYAEKGSDVMQMSDDICTLLRDPFYNAEIKQAGATIVDISSNPSSYSEFSNLFEIAQQPLIIKLRIYRNYQNNYPNIDSFN